MEEQSSQKRCFDAAAAAAHAQVPAEGDAALRNTLLRGQRVTWLLQELPDDRYWFLHPVETRRDGEAKLCCYEFDGGLHAPDERPLGTIILDLVAKSLA